MNKLKSEILHSNKQKNAEQICTIWYTFIFNYASQFAVYSINIHERM